MSPTRETGFFGVSGMSSGSVLPAVAASGNTSSNEKMSRSFSPASASGRRSVSQDVSLDSPVVDDAECARLACGGYPGSFPKERMRNVALTAEVQIGTNFR